MMRYFLYGTLVVLFIATTALAQTDTSQFNIRVFSGEDTEAPTAPVLQTVTPIASSQIDVSWGEATDNFALGGYVLFRDGIPLATTTLTSFSDTGLTPSTTYSYAVQAFDIALNYSSSSNSLATTTPNLPPPPPTPTSTPSSQTGTAVRTVLDELIITPGVSTTSFAITTARPARFEIRFGRTASYELGFSITETFLPEYRTTLTDLEPGTVYEYEVIGYSPLGTPTILKRGQFRTLGVELLSAPQNVNRFSALREGSDVMLSWQLPALAPGDVVRIVRSPLGFPTHPQAGAVLYEGVGTSVRDEGVLNQFSPVYYTAFVIAASGRVSSGAVAQVFLQSSEERVDTDPSEGFAPPPPIEITEAEQQLPEFRLPDPKDIEFFQTGILHTFGQATTTLSASLPLTIRIPKAALAQNLKTIIATITDPQNGQKTYSFLLRINSDDTAYEATIAPLEVAGLSQLTITVYDFEARVAGTRSQILAFEADRVPAPTVVWPDYFIEHYPLVLSSFAIVLLLIIMTLFYMRCRT